MSRIRILPEAVANKIAAGEVVERPASVVKELLENAIDAGAKSIRIEAEGGGRRLIRVVDDGCGMNHDDALLAFERHATSKLRTADDLLYIATLGFRGEALPSIAAVSRLVLETRERTQNSELRTQNSETGDPRPEVGNLTSDVRPQTCDVAAAQRAAEGTRVEFAGGKLIGVKPAGVPPGTSVTVEDLFYSVPARRKFLKSDTTELGHIASLATHYALAHPDKHFVLRTPTQEIINAAPVAELSERVYQLFGRQALEEMLEIPPSAGPIRASITEQELEPDEMAAQISVRGFVSRPQVQRTNRNNIYIFINRRLVRDRLLLHAIGEAYRNTVPAGTFPAVLLFLEMPYAEVDVNVHPSKIEVRFRHPQFVHDFARDAVRHALHQMRPMAAASASFGAAAGGPRDSFPPSRSEGGAFPAPAVGAAAATGFAPARAVIPTDLASGGFELSGAPDQPIPQRLGFTPGQGIEFGATPREFAQNFREAATQQLEVAPHSYRRESLTDLKPLGQVNASFIVAVNGEGLWIIDQHVAHERVLFEQHVRARQAGLLTGQRMLMPLVTELSPRQQVIFEQIAEELRANGFEVEPIGHRSVAIQAAPAGISGGDAERLLTEVLDGVERESQAISMEAVQAKIAASTACHAAIKVNMPLDQTKMEWLLAELAKTETPMSCPHGRPIVLRYSLRDIEKAFKRI
jgi:DNA mismatch repair protein MutL